MRRSTFDKPLPRGDERVAHAAFAYLFAQMCSRAKTFPNDASTVPEWEERLASMGHQAGLRAIQLAASKEPQLMKQRQTTVVGILQLISGPFWQRWFGKEAQLQKERGSDRYFIVDPDPLVTKNIGMTPDYLADNGLQTLNFACYMAGMVRGALEACSFPAQVSIHNENPAEPKETLFCIQFEPRVMDREAKGKRN